MTNFRIWAVGCIASFFLLGVSLAFISMNDQTQTTSGTDDLYEEIISNKAKYEKPAENAVIDKVWKKTPGIEGRAVDVQASYNKMKKDGVFNEKMLVYKRVKPDISLEDLPSSPIYRGHPDKNMVALLINVSWGEEYIPDMVKIFSKYHVKATFFIDGAFASKHKELVQMIEDEGHTIGSHGYLHKDMAQMSENQAEINMEKANEVLYALTNKKVKWLAPPSGSFTMNTVIAADKLGMETILWTVDTIDWKQPTKQVLLQRVLGKVHNGATILMHPTQVTVDSLPELIEQLKKNYRIGSVPTLLSENR
ncbi:polysaccharide deacetylase family protein [Halobacillus salinarum]|uniref:Polysaccharide deacetylase family protein n=1 Tax=Halobacillus salinarum TaxID=2932257 RepID=A0ABY4EG87_9BACI|nr:polysaccharide deacetylase family protein [Halobacillus salinarum]UOQ43010.1 polysaccharide deacetylase family protein [Halobacillus salinarum]